MAHPYKQHRSPLNSFSCLNPKKYLYPPTAKKCFQKAWNFFKDQTVPVTTRNIKNPSKGQKWKFNPKAIRNYAIGTAYTKGADYLDNYNQVARDKTQVKQSEYYKTINNITTPRPLNIDTTGLGYDENFNKIGN